MHFKFDITGMSCAACALRIERAVRAVVGVQKAEVNLLSNLLLVQGDDTLTARQIVSTVEALGYGASLRGDNEQPAVPNVITEAQQLKKQFLSSLILLLPLVLLAMFPRLPVLRLIPPTVSAVIQLILTLAVVGLNRSFFVRGVKHFVGLAPNMDSLVALGSGAAVLFGVMGLFFPHLSAPSYFESAAMILTLVTLGKWLEARAKGKTTGAISALVKLVPAQASVCRAGKEVHLSPTDLRVGDILLCRAGQRIAADGNVVAGQGAVDESALTGESLPQEKMRNDWVAAGTLLVSGYLEVRVERVGQDTTLSKIIQRVQEAANGKAPIARLADKISAIFVPLVLGISLITLGVWYLAGFPFSQAMMAAISVLVIACPCALGLATPTAIVVGVGVAAKLGILIKSAEVLEKTPHIQTVILDKTGTVTTGKMRVAHVFPAAASQDKLLVLGASLEVKSAHPFANALVSYAKEHHVSLLNCSHFQVIPGRGVAGIIQGRNVFGGNWTFINERKIEVPNASQILSQAASEGCTPLFFACEHEFLGSVWLSDTLKPTAKEAVSLLKKLGLRVLLVTGDNLQTATNIAGQVGITEVKAGVLPQEKEDLVRRLQAQGMCVAMVGDGINDAPALARADVSMALGTGTEVAAESADIVLMQEDLRQVVAAILLSRAVIRNIKQNLFWAFFYNVIGVALAAGVFYPFFGWQLSPMFAAAAMSLSSVCVVTNALRLRFFKCSYNPVDAEKKCMKKTLKIQGMMCGHCAAHVERALNALEGVSAKVDLQRQVAVVESAHEIADDILCQAVQNAGYEVVSIY